MARTNLAKRTDAGGSTLCRVTPSPRTDVAQLLDTGPWGRYQQALVALTALTIIFDGADIQLLGVAIPAMMADWGVARAAFAPVLASGLVGMMIGGALGGVAGDRFGRRAALIATLLVFGVLTLAAAAVDNLTALGILRFLAGLGFGGTVPNAAALVSEYVPLRNRPLAVTLAIVCVPIGGTLAALVAGVVLPAYGWRVLFAVGGLMPLVVALIMLASLPESPRFLARHPARWPELVRLLRRCGHDVPVDASFVESGDAMARASLVALFSAAFRRDTVALWGAFGSCLLAVYAGFNWVPAMLTGAGLPVSVASAGIAAFNLGGVVGAIAGALSIARIGSRTTMLAMALAAVAGAGILAAMRIAPNADPLPIVLMLGVTGGLINAVQITMYALAAHLYPTEMRATGVGSAASVGRLGAIASTYAGAWTLEAGGTPLFFGLIAGAMAVAAAALAIVRRHIPPAER
jgi:AAHS family 4-hydroxybenzoate transporter-like MFS transporter